MELAIINYNMSNLYSVREACNKANISCKITSDPEEVLQAKVAILPGVGAFGEAMTQLQKTGLDDCIIRFFESGRPLVGICLGMQLLFESSNEFGENKGLGIVKGFVEKFQFIKKDNIKYPVPQIGWNRIYQHSDSWNKTLLKENKSGDFMYFVHSFYTYLWMIVLYALKHVMVIKCFVLQ